jgi:hypothetical protein
MEYFHAKLPLDKIRPEFALPLGNQRGIGDRQAVNILAFRQEVEGGITVLQRQAIQLVALRVQSQLAEGQAGEFT